MNRPINRTGRVLALICLAAMSLSSGAFASDPARGEAGSIVPVVGKSSTRSIQDTLALEKQALHEYREELRRLRGLRDAWKSALNAYRIQVSTYQNVLAVPLTQVKDLDRAWNELRTSTVSVEDHLKTATADFNTIEAALASTREQFASNQGQLKKLEASGGKDAAAREMVSQLRGLITTFSEIENTLIKIRDLYAAHLEEVRDINESLFQISFRYEAKIKQNKQRNLFERQGSPLITLKLSEFRTDIDRLKMETKNLFSGNFWIEEAKGLWTAAGFSLISYGILFILFVILFVRVRERVQGLEQKPFFSDRAALKGFCLLLCKTIVPAGITLLLFLFSRIDVIYFSTPSISLVAQLLAIWVITDWCRQFIRLWHTWQALPLPGPAVSKISRLTTVIRWYGWAHVLVMWVLDIGGAAMTLGHLVFEIWLLSWSISFSKMIWSERNGEPPGYPAIGMVAAGLAVFISSAGLLMELTGFASLAFHWYLSWGRSAVVALWWGLFLFMLLEWGRSYRLKTTAEDRKDRPASPIQWLTIRLGELIWFVSFIIAVVLAWGGQRTVLLKLYSALGHPLEIGNMRFSLLGIFYALLVLMLTQAAVRLWRFFFLTKFLSKSGLETGLQDSITTLTSYIVWTFGIVIALHVFGLNTASLAVAFGALGIGLGFGLQNIFNNFISGIILLFERPIQVGDDVEINGIWATVKKINVRSTVVQTYDNASLIIPNSEFVSSQVTNWSFKDKRVRRKIAVGVAYGSDVELVRSTLLEVADNSPQVLKHPKPDVLFSDFGDSALIFVLRIYTLVDKFLLVESAVRFEIDRLFRERGIEISFPQRDIHVRTLPEEKSLTTGAADPEEGKEPPRAT